MYLLTLRNKKKTVLMPFMINMEKKILFLFEEEDDAVRYALLLEEDEDEEMEIVEVDDNLAIKTCKMYNYKYSVITPNDIVVPPHLNDYPKKSVGKTFFPLEIDGLKLIFKKNIQIL